MARDSILPARFRATFAFVRPNVDARARVVHARPILRSEGCSFDIDRNAILHRDLEAALTGVEYYYIPASHMLRI